MYLDVVDESTTNAAKIQTHHHTGSDTQLWKITTNSDRGSSTYGYSTIINVKSGKALDVPAATLNDGQQLQIWDKAGPYYKAQLWKIIEQENGYKIVSALDESYAIDLRGASIEDNTAVQTRNKYLVTAQIWTFTKASDENTTTITDKGKLFDTSVYITDTQPGTITWENIPDGWETTSVTYYNYYYRTSKKGIVYTDGSYYSGFDAKPVARIDKCCKVNGKWASIRLTFSNISAYGVNTLQTNASCPDKTTGTSICFENDNIWSGLWIFSIDTFDMNIEFFYTDTGETISLEGAWYTASSLNGGVSGSSDPNLGESCKYLTDKTIDSYTIDGTGLVQFSDGTWMGGTDMPQTSEWDVIGNENFPIGSVAFNLKDEKPTFRIGTSARHRMGYIFNLSPLTIATPPNPTKNVLIAE